MNKQNSQNPNLFSRFHVIIPAGGVGTRLWPLSRAAAPKFLHDLTGSGSAMIRATYDRLSVLSPNRITVVTGVAHESGVLRHLPELKSADLVLEPEPKDSAAAIGLAAAILHMRNPDAIMGSFAADHVISPQDSFHDAVREAVVTAATGKIVTIGIQPTTPSTGFGYIRKGGSLDILGATSAHHVVEFVEKPNQDIARQFYNDGAYLWNAGMFVAPARLILKHLQRSQPKLYNGVVQIASVWDTSERNRAMSALWPTLPKIAIDYAVAEPAAAVGDVAVVPGNFQWEDVGDFAALGRLNPASEGSGVTVLGDRPRVYTDSATGVVVSDTQRVIALIGIENVVLVDTADALLVTTSEHAQSVKLAVDQLRAQGDHDVL